MNLIRRFLLIDLLFQGGRMFVGGISAAYLLSCGLHAADLAMIKTVQGVIFFIGEVPTGIFCDRFGRRLSLLLGVASAVLGLLLYLYGNSMETFLVAEAVTALSLCWWSGAYDAWVCSETKIEDSPEKTSWFFHTNTVVSQSAIVILGWGGGFLAGSYTFKAAYVVAIAIMVLLFFVVYRTPETAISFVPAPETIQNTGVIKAAIANLLQNAAAKRVLFFTVTMQLLMQPLFHYWQPLFLELNKDLNAKGLGIIFAIYTAATAVASWYLRRKRFRKEILILCGWICFYYIFSITTGFYLAMGLFVILQVGYVLFRSQMGAVLANASPSNLRGSIISISTFVSRLGMLISLLIINQMLVDKISPDLRQYENLFQTLGFIAVVLVFLFLLVQYISFKFKEVTDEQNCIKTSY